MDIIMTTVFAFAATAVVIAYGLRSSEQRLPVRIRVEDRKRRR